MCFFSFLSSCDNLWFVKAALLSGAPSDTSSLIEGIVKQMADLDVEVAAKAEEKSGGK